uniref:Uncharacterized protein n=1 Tax=Aplanochytrium stocchinoi TaxID=215587 RepID=A0A7S3LQZ4_9STRA
MSLQHRKGMASVISNMRRFVNENYVKLQYFFPWSSPLESLTAKTLKRIVVKYGTNVNRKQLPIDKRELAEKARAILAESLLTSLIPVVLAWLVVLGTLYCVKGRAIRFYRESIKPYNPRWLLLTISFHFLSYAQALLSLGVLLSWVQQPFSLPRMIVDWLLNPVYNIPVFQFFNAGGINFTPLVLGYICRQLHARFQIQLFQTEKYRQGN